MPEYGLHLWLLYHLVKPHRRDYNPKVECAIVYHVELIGNGASQSGDNRLLRWPPLSHTHAHTHI